MKLLNRVSAIIWAVLFFALVLSSLVPPVWLS